MSVAVVLFAFALARALYYTVGELEYDDETLGDYLQFADPSLLQSDLLTTVFHLHSQPPLFNLFLGVVLKAFPAHSTLAFNVMGVLTGVVLVLTTLELQVRLGVGRRLATAVTVLVAASPMTVLYENWLYPTYVVTALLALATFALHRFLTGGRLLDASCFFVLLGVVVLTRGTYHPLWLVVPAVALLVAVPGARRRTAIAVAAPLAVVVAASVLTFVQFGTVVTGEAYRDINLAQMTTMKLSPTTVESLIREGRISPINNFSVYDSVPADYLPHVPRPPPTGVAVLDSPVKTSGAANWHSEWFMHIAEQYGADARVVLGAYPEVYLRSVGANVARFFVPPDQSQPFLGMREDHPMRDVVRAWDVVVAGQAHYKGLALVNLVAIPASVVFGLLFARRGLSKRDVTRRVPRPTRADALTVLFMVYNVVYVGVVGVLFSSNDQSRYRFEVMPLVAVLLAMLATAWSRGHRGRRHGAAETPRDPNWTKG